MEEMYMQPARNATLSEQKLANEARASAGVARDALVLLKQPLDESADSAGTRHVRLRAAMLDLMARRIWGPGDKLPPEREIADAVGLSLGTVQRTLSSLASDNVVVRRHGHGTFISASSQSDQLLHFRFVGDDGVALMPVYAEAIDRTLVKGAPPYASFLGGGKEFIRVRRLINVADEFACLSEFYIDGTRFRDLLTMPMQQLHRVLLRTVLAERFNAPTLSLTQHMHASQFSDEVGELLQLQKKRRFGIVAEVFSFSHHAAPVSFQRIYIPPDVRRLEVGSRKVHAR